MQPPVVQVQVQVHAPRPRFDSSWSMCNLGLDSDLDVDSDSENEDDGTDVSVPLAQAGRMARDLDASGDGGAGGDSPTTPKVTVSDRHSVCSDRVPLPYRACIDFLCQPAALCEVGLFRVSGNKREIDALLRVVDRGDRLHLPAGTDPAAVCGVLKQLIRRQGTPFDTAQSRSLHRAVFSECGSLYEGRARLANLTAFFST